MVNIEVELLIGNFFNMPKFLAKMTQRGHIISSLDDLMELYDEALYDEEPSDYFMTTPHTTLRRFNYIVVAIYGLSTKCVSQLRTHAKRLTFLSTSTQYSSFEGHRAEHCVIPTCDRETTDTLIKIYNEILEKYDDLIEYGVDKDIASYVLPQGLRKCLIVGGNLDDWQYVMRTRLCHRNSEETQQVMKLIYHEIKTKAGEQWVKGMLPSCCTPSGCQEGVKCCGKPFKETECTLNL